MESGIRKVGVIGIGLMGSGIAQVAATRGFDTLVVDVSPEILEEGMKRIRESLQRLAESHQKSAGKSDFNSQVSCCRLLRHEKRQGVLPMG